jgi:hypothetical protein
VIVNRPFALYPAISLAVMPFSKVRLPSPIACSRQRCWNSHIWQCSFKSSGGGDVARLALSNSFNQVVKSLSSIRSRILETTSRVFQNRPTFT